MKLITIMICTYKRPEKLKDTLNSILHLDCNLNRVAVVVVDNDICKSAKSLVYSYKDRLNIIYGTESNRGISNARNRCLSIASRIDCEFVAFIDDDETFEKRWLEESINCLNKNNADIVAGPVYRVYPESTPSWIIKSKLFEPKEMDDGTVLDKCATGNVLMKKENIYNMRFDIKYAVSGGEDTKFFMEMNKKGKKIVYSKKSVIYETIELDRINIGYIAKRTFREASYYVHMEKEVLKVNAIVRLVKSIGKILIAVLLIPFSLIGGVQTIAQNSSRIIIGIGEIYGLFSKKILRGY